MKCIKWLLPVLLLVTSSITSKAQDAASTPDFRKLSWTSVASKMPEEWFASQDAKDIADVLLKYQSNAGGWSKNYKFNVLPLSDKDVEQLTKEKSGVGATIDNGATSTEMKFLARVYANTGDERYRDAFMKALDYLFVSQYDNGGWPQFYPYRTAVNYAKHITYNDDAIVNVMRLLKGVFEGDKLYAPLKIDQPRIAKARHSFDKGVDCILKTQIISKGVPTVWCAQHDEVTLLPADARSFELKSFSGGESVGIVLLLMDIKDPSPEVINSVKYAVKWFIDNRLDGTTVVTKKNSEGVNDKFVEHEQFDLVDTYGPGLWARFYDLETGKPFFCDRDGVKKDSLSEIGYERRNGYSWYTNSPSNVLKKYPAWAKKNKVE